MIQGFDNIRRKHMVDVKATERRVMNAAIEKLKVEDPRKYAELLKRAQDEAYDARVRVSHEEAEQQRRVEERKRQELERMRTRLCPVVYGLPAIDMSDVFGMLAFRVWRWQNGLKSSAVSYMWRELNFADEPPTPRNNRGLYAVKLTGLDVMSTAAGFFQTIGRQNVCGFVELRGRVEEHTDGVLRAEVARLVCLFVSTENNEVVSVVRRLYELYPTTLVYVLNPEQIADMIMREVLRQRYLRQEWPEPSDSAAVSYAFPAVGKIADARWFMSEIAASTKPYVRLVIDVEPFVFEGVEVNSLFSAVPCNDYNSSYRLLCAALNGSLEPGRHGESIPGLKGLGVGIRVETLEFQGIQRLRTAVIDVE